MDRVDPTDSALTQVTFIAGGAVIGGALREDEPRKNEYLTLEWAGGPSGAQVVQRFRVVDVERVLSTNAPAQTGLQPTFLLRKYIVYLVQVDSASPLWTG